MKESFKTTRLTGSIKVKMDAAKGVWEAEKQDIVNAIIRICELYQRNRDTLTLRQLYYQLVANDIIPNHDKVYDKLGKIKDDIVYSGLVDWDIFEDRGRVPLVAHYEHSIESALRNTAHWFRLHKQTGQERKIEVWTEKDAISGILKKVTMPYNVDLVVNKGYTSSTAAYGAYSRFVEAMSDGQKVTILYFGDHDPSGLDMIRDIRDRLMFMFTRGYQFGDAMANKIHDWWYDNDYDIYTIADMDGYENVAKLGSSHMLTDEKHEEYDKLFEQGKNEKFIKDNELFEIVPIGLTMAQIKQYNPPPNPAKITDPRAGFYIKQFGQISWEVDALTPAIMREIVEVKIRELMDLDKYDEVNRQEKMDKEKILSIVDSMNDVDDIEPEDLEEDDDE